MNRYITTLRQFVTILGLFCVLAFLSSPVANAQINDALLGNKSETKTLLENLSGGYGNIVQPGALVYNIIAVVLGFLGIACVVMMMYGGFLWITAAGEEDKAKKGTTILFQATVGAIIVFAAYTVTYFVLVQLSTVVTTPTP